MLTPKQQSILEYVNTYGKHGISATDIGIGFGFPRKKADKWAKPALKELVKQKIVNRIGDLYFPRENEQE